MIYAKYPFLSASEVKDAILNNVDKLDNLDGLCVTGGKLNAYKALSNAHTVHTPAYQYWNKDKHTVLCKYCSEILHSEEHNFTRYFGSKPGRICSGCGYILFFDGTGLIPYQNEDDKLYA